jgi:hypothetical protein
MMTRRVWRAFRHPPIQHPLYERLVTSAAFSPSLRLLWWNNSIVQGLVWLWALLLLLEVRALPLMLLSGTVYGALWATGVSGTILQERDSRTYDLLCLTPAGSFGVNWVLAIGCLHQGEAFRQVNSQEVWTIRLMLMIPVIVTANLALNRALTSSPIAPIWLLVLVIVFYCDHIQSIIMGTLFGLLAPQTVAPGDTRLWAAAGLLLAQLTSFGLLVLIVLLNPLAPITPLAAPALALITFVGVRELIIYGQIICIRRLFHATVADIQSLLKPVPGAI